MWYPAHCIIAATVTDRTCLKHLKASRPTLAPFPQCLQQGLLLSGTWQQWVSTTLGSLASPHGPTVLLALSPHIPFQEHLRSSETQRETQEQKTLGLWVSILEAQCSGI